MKIKTFNEIIIWINDIFAVFPPILFLENEIS